MKPGGGSAKGAAFERLVCTQLSLWITKGARSDALERNVQSGGRFTKAVRGKKQEKGMPGDLMAAHPSAFDFLSTFMVECKHLASLGLEEYLYDLKGSSQLARIIAFAREQAFDAERPLLPMIVARENRRPIMVFMNTPTFRMVERSTRLGVKLHYHAFQRDTITMFGFEDLISLVNPVVLLNQLT